MWTALLLLLCVGVAAGAPADRPDAPPKPATARMVHYTGRVQGVGFRATTADIARNYLVTGWVKNLEDGRVQLLVEGPADAVDGFLKAVRERWRDNIEKEESEVRTPGGEFKKFEIVK